MNHAGDLVYSTKSARLHIEPHLRVKHEMARLNFLVQAYDTRSNKDGKYAYSPLP